MTQDWMERREGQTTYFEAAGRLVGYVEHVTDLPRALACVLTDDGRMIVGKGSDDECLSMLRELAADIAGA